MEKRRVGPAEVEVLTSRLDNASLRVNGLLPFAAECDLNLVSAVAGPSN